METGDFTAPSTETPVKVEVAQNNHVSGRSSPEPESVSDSDSAESVSETYSILMEELHKEIDECGVLHKGELQDFLCSKLKPLLDKFASGMSRVQRLSEQLQQALELTGTPSLEDKDFLDRQAKLFVPSLKDTLSKIGLEKNMDDLQSYLISSDRACLLSDLEALRMELRDGQQRHQVTTLSLQQSLRATEEHYQALVGCLQEGLRSTETQVRCLQQLLQASEEKTEALRHGLDTVQQENLGLRRDLGLSEDGLRELRQELGGYEGRVQALRLDLGTSEESAQLLRMNLGASEELCRALQQQLLVSEQKGQALQEAAAFWESRAHDAEAQGQRRQEEQRAEHKREVRELTRALGSSRERLDSQQQETQRSLDEAAQRERALQDAVTTEQAQRQRQVEKLQQDADRAEEEKVVAVQTLRGQIIGLKNQLLEELCRANKKLEGLANSEKELQDTIKNLRTALKQQMKGRDLALDCLRRRHHDVAKTQRLLEANIQYCSQAPVRPEAGAPHEAPLTAQSALLQPQDMRQDLQEVKAHLQSALDKEEEEEEAETSGRREAGEVKEEWQEVLRRAEEWQREAERLVRLTEELVPPSPQGALPVSSLEYVKVDSTQKGDEREATDGACAQSTLPNMSPLPRPHSAGMVLQSSFSEESAGVSSNVIVYTLRDTMLSIKFINA
ncbi:cingulin-like [Sardina pilchardus]|uniref:cingulin-like n=1 Tax=Sardina pilchardus TaxID=27697 RepID=UPI002E14C1D1